jgi:hypothetical protein
VWSVEDQRRGADYVVSVRGVLPRLDLRRQPPIMARRLPASKVQPRHQASEIVQKGLCDVLGPFGALVA